MNPGTLEEATLIVLLAPRLSSADGVIGLDCTYRLTTSQKPGLPMGSALRLSSADGFVWP